MKFVTNLVFKGQCQQAFENYARIFNGKITAMIPFAEAPADAVPDSLRQSPGIMHAWLDVGDQSIMGCDMPAGQGEGMAGFSASFHSDDIRETQRVFDALSDGGSIHKSFAATFWSPGFGMLVDRYGTPWTINTNGPVAWIAA